MHTLASAPIGVFDSGMGGLSILRALQTALPQEDFVYFADSAHTPYGEKSEDFIVQRSVHITELLRREHGIKALVIACNTATAAAAEHLRQSHPDLPIVGVEPAVKPACASSRSGHIAVLATPHTVATPRLAKLIERYGQGLHIYPQACSGLAKAIEELPFSGDVAGVRQLMAQYLQALPLPLGAGPQHIDTVVLGCTHYPLMQQGFAQLLGPQVLLLETGPAVAKQTAACLPPALRQPEPRTGTLQLIGSGPSAQLQQAAAYWAAQAARPSLPLSSGPTP